MISFSKFVSSLASLVLPYTLVIGIKVIIGTVWENVWPLKSSSLFIWLETLANCLSWRHKYPPPPRLCPFSWAFPSMEQTVHFIRGFDDLYLLNFRSPHISSIVPFKWTETLCECHTKTSQLWNWNRPGVSLALNEAIHFRADKDQSQLESICLLVKLPLSPQIEAAGAVCRHNSKGFESINQFACECVSVLYTFLISVAKTGSLSGPKVLIYVLYHIRISPNMGKGTFDVQIQKCDMVACHRSALSSCPHLLSVSGNTMLSWQFELFEVLSTCCGCAGKQNQDKHG